MIAEGAQGLEDVIDYAMALDIDVPVSKELPEPVISVDTQKGVAVHYMPKDFQSVLAENSPQDCFPSARTPTESLAYAS